MITEIEEKYVKAVEEFGSVTAAARELGVHHTTVSGALRRVAARESASVTARSALYDAKGNLKLEWVKTVPNASEKASEAALEAFKAKIPKYKTQNAPVVTNQNLLNLYIVTDYHLGMYAWKEETGEDWDLNIASSLLCRWIDYSIANSPNASRGLLAQLGDFLHWDGLEAVTPTNKHVLDADTRFQKVVRTAVYLIRYIVDRLLAKHDEVELIVADANHDPASAIWMREWLLAHYSDEPRVVINSSADSYYCSVFGDVSLFFHHGHLRKISNVDSTFASKFRKIFGTTTYSYAHLGHLHHIDSKETDLMLVEQHRTLAAKDAYASRHGYMSGRDAKVITYHKDFGEVSRISVTPQMLEV
jgi:hypothetical protein